MTRHRPDGTSIALYVDPDGLSYSVHRFNDCTTCHTSKPHDVETPLTKLSLAEKCGSCHEYQYGQYINSVHGAPQASGNSDPATCTDCHSADSNPHNVVRVLDPAASTYPKNIAADLRQVPRRSQVDGQVRHRGEGLRFLHEIVPRQGDEAFRGKRCPAAIGHGDMRELSWFAQHEPRSPTPTRRSPAWNNLLKTCRTCHPSAEVGVRQGVSGPQSRELRLPPPGVLGREVLLHIQPRHVDRWCVDSRDIDQPSGCALGHSQNQAPQEE